MTETRTKTRPQGIHTVNGTLRFDISGGLHGRVIAFRQSAVELRTSGALWLLRDDAPDANRPYSTHMIHTFEDGSVSAYGGRYDLTWMEARQDFDVRG